MERRKYARRSSDKAGKEKPFRLFIPAETKMRFLKIRSDVRMLTDKCYICEAERPWPEIHNAFNQGACNSCMIYEFGKGE